jgi:hypothetical protein
LLLEEAEQRRNEVDPARAWHRNFRSEFPTSIAAEPMQEQAQVQIGTTSLFPLNSLASRLPVAIFRPICFLFLNTPQDTPVKSTGGRQGCLSFSSTSFVHPPYFRHTTHTRTRAYRDTVALVLLPLGSSLCLTCSSSAMLPTPVKVQFDFRQLLTHAISITDFEQLTGE